MATTNPHDLNQKLNLLINGKDANSSVEKVSNNAITT
jgi:hypothetical protein